MHEHEAIGDHCLSITIVQCYDIYRLFGKCVVSQPEGRRLVIICSISLGCGCCSARNTEQPSLLTRYQETTTWDEDMIYGCLCDSSWSVGLGAGQVQEPEYFGPDCGLSKSLTLKSI